MPEFIPGLRLSELFYREAVAPILARALPHLPYAAALIGYGSEVLGFDTPRSTDHNWGPRLQLFIADDDLDTFGPVIDETLRRELPQDVRGYPTNFGPTEEAGTFVPTKAAGPVNHKVELVTVAGFVRAQLGVELSPEPEPADWLACSEQALLEITAGEVFHDGPGDLTRARAALAYYPHDVWLYLLAVQWSRIGQLHAFVGRCGEVGDDLGSALVTASLVRDLMRLGFLMERRYAPYAKWLGTAVARLPCADRLLPPLQAALAAPSWKDRERHLATAYAIAADLHNALGITDPRPTAVSSYFSRPFLVIDADGFAAAIRERIIDERILALPPTVGSADQFLASTDDLAHSPQQSWLKSLYNPSPGGTT